MATAKPRLRYKRFNRHALYAFHKSKADAKRNLRKQLSIHARRFVSVEILAFVSRVMTLSKRSLDIGLSSERPSLWMSLGALSPLGGM